ncbi:MAG: hypothetical protein LUQ65_11705 [Candidatus Helarchaeota archaeon]|nr:hypothetical protein [Candidatus Helarchaeota archaeon]
MACQACGSVETAAKCIVCGKELCSACVVLCGLKDKDICVQKAGSIIVFRCPSTYCEKCGREALIFKCKDCGIVFCKSALDLWAKPCKTCKDYICGFCYETHVATCKSYYDKEEALDKLFKLVQGKKKSKPT